MHLLALKIQNVNDPDLLLAEENPLTQPQFRWRYPPKATQCVTPREDLRWTLIPTVFLILIAVFVR